MSEINRVHYVTTTNIALAILGGICVLIRLFTRLFVLKSPGADDLFIFIGVVLCIGSTVLICVQTKYGLGVNQDTVSLPDQAEFFKIMYALVLLYIAICFFVKVSIVLFYGRLSAKPLYRKAVWGLIVFNALVFITMSLPCAFGCKPLSYFWDRSKPGKCIEHQKLYIVNVALNILLDFTCLLLPIPVIWGTQLSLRKKVVILAMFGLGGFVCIASCIRVTKLFGPASATNITMAAVDSHTWSMIEVYMMVVVACIPTYKPLIGSCLGDDRKAGSYGVSSHGRLPSGKSGYMTKINDVEMTRKKGVYPEVSDEDLIGSNRQHI